MHEILTHPAFANLAFCLLGLWPLVRVMRRVGVPGWWGGVLLLNLVLPGLGVALVAGVLCHATWPLVPKPVARVVKTKIWGQG